jgi:hypothetical protein
MTKHELKSKFPKTYSEILQEGVLQERKEAQTKAQARIEHEKETNHAFNFKL